MSTNWKASIRSEEGRGASRRLRKAGLIPGIIYGNNKDAVMVNFKENEVKKALMDSNVFNTVFNIDVEGGKAEKVVIKDIQRHPSRDEILHMDMQRVIDKSIITKVVPFKFIGANVAPGVKKGGLMTFIQKSVEVRCAAKDLPAVIEVDVSAMDAGESMRLSNIQLPKGVEITALTHGNTDYDQSVVSVAKSRK